MTVIDDILNGTADDDVIESREGNDVLTGGAGDDIFVFADGSGFDTITDFTAGVGGDTLDIRDLQQPVGVPLDAASQQRECDIDAPGRTQNVGSQLIMLYDPFTVVCSAGFVTATLLFLPNRWPLYLAGPVLSCLLALRYVRRRHLSVRPTLSIRRLFELLDEAGEDAAEDGELVVEALGEEEILVLLHELLLLRRDRLEVLHPGDGRGMPRHEGPVAAEHDAGLHLVLRLPQLLFAPAQRQLGFPARGAVEAVADHAVRPAVRVEQRAPPAD